MFSSIPFIGKQATPTTNAQHAQRDRTTRGALGPSTPDPPCRAVASIILTNQTDVELFSHSINIDTAAASCAQYKPSHSPRFRQVTSFNLG